MPRLSATLFDKRRQQNIDEATTCFIDPRRAEYLNQKLARAREALKSTTAAILRLEQVFYWLDEISAVVGGVPLRVTERIGETVVAAVGGKIQRIASVKKMYNSPRRTQWHLVCMDRIVDDMLVQHDRFFSTKKAALEDAKLWVAKGTKPR